jgi:hypothetical protein
MALVNREYVNGRRIAASIPRVPDNDSNNRNWRSVRLWAETHSAEILKVYDAVKSKTAVAELLGLRSLSPFYTACLKEGCLDLVPDSRRVRGKTMTPSQQADNAGLKRQMAGLALELRRTRRAVARLHRWLQSHDIMRGGDRQ